MIHPSLRLSTKRCLGVSLVEILVTVAVLGLFATYSSFAVSVVYKNAQHNKLTSDVEALNSALKMVTSNAGDLSGISDPNSVLSERKTSLSKEDRERHVGAPSGRMIDNRLVAVSVDADSRETVNIELKLENTVNVPGKTNPSTDYVKITNLQQNIGLEINGVAYQMRPEFGATDSFGFSTNSEFHVYEGATGQGEILASFTSKN